MSPILATILVAGTALTLVAAVIAVRAGLRALVAYARLRRELASEVERLGRRAGELEGRAARLEVRYRELPVRVERIQGNLADIRVLAGNLYATLAQARRALSYSGIKTSGTSWLSSTVRRRMSHTGHVRRARHGRG